MIRPNSGPYLCDVLKSKSPFHHSFGVEANKTTALLLLAGMSLAGCSSTPEPRQSTATEGVEPGITASSTDTPSSSGEAVVAGGTAASTADEASTLRSLVKQLTQRLQQMESKLTALNDKIDATRSGVETLALERAGKSSNGFPITSTVSVQPNPVDTSRGAGDLVRGANSTSPNAASPKKPSHDFTNDGPISDYRKALILLETGKNKESIEAFGKFIDAHPDHILAGSAQFHLGEAHFKNGDYSSARSELLSVLTTYDRSTFVPDTLKLLVLSSEQLKDSASVVQHRQTLLSRYPQSPAAKEFMNARVVPAESGNQANSQPPKASQHNFDGEARQTSGPASLDSPPETQLDGHSGENAVPTAPSPLESKNSNSNATGDTTGH